MQKIDCGCDAVVHLDLALSCDPSPQHTSNIDNYVRPNLLLEYILILCTSKITFDLGLGIRYCHQDNS